MRVGCVVSVLGCLLFAATAKRNCYDKLRISTDATPHQIKKAFRKLALKFHPDTVKDMDNKEKAEEKFKELAKCYEILKDDDARKMYDASGYNENFDQMGAAPGGGGPNAGGHFHFKSDSANFDFADLFSSFFGGQMPGAGNRGSRSHRFTNMGGANGGFGGGQQGAGGFGGGGFGGGPQHGRGGGTPQSGGKPQQAAAKKKVIKVSVSLEQLLEDSTKTVSTGKARSGRGEVTVDIPKGALEGAKLKPLEDSRFDFQLKVAKHRLFERRKGKLQSDLYYRLPVTLRQAVAGGSFEVPTIDGGMENIEMEYVTPESSYKMKGFGLPRFRKATKSSKEKVSRGAMYVEFDIKFPRSLSQTQKEEFDAVAKGWNFPLIAKHRRKKSNKSKMDL